MYDISKIRAKFEELSNLATSLNPHDKEAYAKFKAVVASLRSELTKLTTKITKDSKKMVSTPPPAEYRLHPWFPTSNFVFQRNWGAQPFKAEVLKGSEKIDPNSYVMFWSVDKGQLNPMDSSYTQEGPHKEAPVSVKDWHWKNDNIYTVNFTANINGKTLTADVPIKVEGAPPVPQPPVNPPPVNPSPVHPTPTVPPGTSNLDNPLKDFRFFKSRTQLTDWLDLNQNHLHNRLLREKIDSNPTGIWVSRDWSTPIGEIVKTANEKNEAPIFIMYNAIKRDLGSHSAGGANTIEEYLKDLDTFVNQIRPLKAGIVILEPDSLPHMVQMSGEDRLTRIRMLRDGLMMLKSVPQIQVYLDAGHSNWHPAERISELLREIGHDKVALNVSNRRPNDELIRYAEKISNLTGIKHFVIDTSRNAIPQQEWCNPHLEGVGIKPTLNTGHPLIDAYLWLKLPGESDGWCGGSPVGAGGLWIDRAIMLAQNGL